MTEEERILKLATSNAIPSSLHDLPDSLRAVLFEVDKRGVYLLQLARDVDGVEVTRYKAMIHELKDLIACLEARVAENTPDRDDGTICVSVM